MKTLSPRTHGFSLVEITLALGIGAVALITVLGLLGVAADANGGAGRDTMLVTMSNAVMNELRGAPSFEALLEAKPTEFKPRPTAVASKQPIDTSYFFTESGKMVPRDDSDVLYECTVIKSADMPRPADQKGVSNLLKLQLVFTSPVAANPNDWTKRPNRHVIHGSIARF